MAVQAMVFKGAQLGVETTPGTGVAADKQLQSLGFGRIVPRSEGGLRFRGQGNKLPSATVPTGKQWSEIPFEGPLTYNEICYILSSGINYAAPSADGTNGKKWTFKYGLSTNETIKAYTYENGNSGRAQKAVGCQVTNFDITMSKGDSMISGALTGYIRQDDITITPAPTVLTPVIVAPQKFDVKFADTQAALAGASVWGLVTKAALSVPQIYAPLFRMNSTDTSVHAMVPQALDGITLAVTVGDDDADYGALIALISSGAEKWIRVKATGDVIAGGVPSAYDFQLDFCGTLIEPESREEEAGAALNTFTFGAQYNSTSLYAFQIEVVNAMAAL